jgi:simple sugar transport system permease protein
MIMIRLEARETASTIAAIVVPVVAVALSLATVSASFGRFDVDMAPGLFEWQAALTATLTPAAALVFTGLAAAFAFRIRLFNLGGEGQFLAGALAAIAVAGAAADAPAWTKYPLLLVAGATAGGVLMFIPAALRIKRGTDEAIVTLLLNFVVLACVQFALPKLLAAWTGQAQAPGAASAFWAGPLVALAAAIVVFMLLRYTIWGLQIRGIAANPDAASFVGVRMGRMTVLVGSISGALAGLGGAVAVAGGHAIAGQDFYSGFGYAGIAVAVLAGRSVAGAVVAAVVVAAVLVAAGAFTGPSAGVDSRGDLFIALVLTLGLAGAALARYRVRFMRPAQ